MDYQEYDQKRLQDQIDWYAKKSRSYKNSYYRLRVIEIFAAALIPFASGLIIALSDTYKLYGTIFVGILGLIVTITSSMISLKRYQENWVEYRKTSESLLREKFLFETQVEPYNGENRFNLIVQTAEMLMTKENTTWGQNMLNPPPDKQNAKK